MKGWLSTHLFLQKYACLDNGKPSITSTIDHCLCAWAHHSRQNHLVDFPPLISTEVIPSGNRTWLCELSACRFYDIPTQERAVLIGWGKAFVLTELWRRCCQIYVRERVCVLLMSVSQTVSGAAGEMTELSHQAQRSAVNQTLRFRSQGHRSERVRGQSKMYRHANRFFLRGGWKTHWRRSNCAVSELLTSYTISRVKCHHNNLKIYSHSTHAPLKYRFEYFRYWGLLWLWVMPQHHCNINESISPMCQHIESCPRK